MSKTLELLASLTSTDLVRLKDGVDVEADRLSEIVKTATHLTPDIAKDLASVYYSTTDLSLRLSVIIEAKIAEDRETHKTPF